MPESVEFRWKKDDFADLLRANEYDDAVQLSLKHMRDKNARILEAGSGSGRVVKYFYDLGYHNIHGIEINNAAVKYINTNFPELNIIQGDILNMPYDNGYFGVVVSYGVIEHFPSGLDAPLKSIWRVLQNDGLAVVTVPSFNPLRRFIYYSDRFFESVNPVINIKRLFKTSVPRRNREDFLYHVYPQYGKFFEYRLTPNEFASVCINAGFEIVESVPICHIDGLYHLFNPILGDRFIKFKNWQFHISKIAQILNDFLKKVPFLHNHMHACVLKKAHHE